MTLSSEWRKQVVRRHLANRDVGIPISPRSIQSSDDCKSPPKPASEALLSLIARQGYEGILSEDARQRLARFQHAAG